MYALEFKKLLDEYLTVCKSHNFNHAMKVLDNAMNAIKKSSCDLTSYQKEAILLVSLLYDADDLKFFKSNKNNENARKILSNKRQMPLTRVFKVNKLFYILIICMRIYHYL